MSYFTSNLMSIVDEQLIFDTDCKSIWSKYNNFDSLKSKEVETIIGLINRFKLEDADRQVYNGYFVNYTVPQMSKEFDLLKVGERYVVDLELKFARPAGDKLKKQQMENLHYLMAAFDDRESHVITYILDEDKFFYNESEVEASAVIKILGFKGRNVLIDDYFNPKKFLVSPYNNPDKFLANQYLLTSQQNTILYDLISKFDSKRGEVALVSGDAGTGKTLVALTLMKMYMNAKKKVVFVFGGNLNAGQRMLVTEGYNIISVSTFVNRYGSMQDLPVDDVLFIFEESQRYRKNVTDIIDGLIERNLNMVLFYDPKQQLSKYEINDDTVGWIKNLSDFERTLSQKIRNNTDVAGFVKHFFDNSKRWHVTSSEAVTFEVVDSVEEGKEAARELIDEGVKFIDLTPARLGRYLPTDNMKLGVEDTSHSVLGQEFDHVAVMIDNSFKYSTDNKLTTQGYPSDTPYNPLKMLYQNMTRARFKLTVIVANNKELFAKIFYNTEVTR